jgi:hypothetical protein
MRLNQFEFQHECEVSLRQGQNSNCACRVVPRISANIILIRHTYSTRSRRLPVHCLHALFILVVEVPTKQGESSHSVVELLRWYILGERKFVTDMSAFGEKYNFGKMVSPTPP